MAKAFFVVPLADLERGAKQVTWSIPPEWLRLALADTEATPLGPGELSVELSKNGRQVMVRGEARVSVEMPDVRTLEPVPVELRPEVFLLLSPAPDPADHRHRKGRRGRGPAKGPAKGHSGNWAEDPVLSDSEAAEDLYQGEQIELDSFVREFLLLELPMMPTTKGLHAEAAPAIAPAPADSGEAAEERVDPRLAPLAAIKSRLSQKKE